ncbi:sigma-54-dependent Fis family transcriptional regulator [Sporomusa sp.]|uniref:sigma-54-dependent Fis family transcriptional regulator n=1 Tax=Sporomusa sp. TaxID=2078658 RepID=UPI002C975B4D|nr:sigma-54-dependent Fis family transcriptional regulator [Sporomusa sp.]HWR44174.1 sigma-54-dependent Fis family transcriptional regulator [Sporomusa sp.]
MFRDKPADMPSKDLVWKKFINNGKIESQIILPEIADSWVRCSQVGLNPDDGRAQNVLEHADVCRLLEKNQEIINIAKPFMANIYEFFRNSGFIVVLADVNGYVMECFGDRDSLTSAKKLHFVRGASWRECDVGTNAIAIGLATGKPVQVSGAEHYCAKHHWWTCSAAPIYGADGQIVAFLDLSGPAQAAYSHTLGMVAAAANAISMQIGIQQKNYELSLMNKHLSSIFNTMSDGVILFDRLGLVKEYNPIAKKLLGQSGDMLCGASVQTIFKGNNQLIQKLLNGKETHSEIEFQTVFDSGPNRCVISGESIVDKQGCINGGVIILRPAEKVHSLINRLSGHYTTFQFKSILGNSIAILEAVRQASAAAVTASNVILQGESGTGKEMFAQAIHNKSARCSGPFIALNCGAIPRELVGSELFGYEDGAFTGAKRGGRPGNFELASGGTLFLDEIGDMPLEQQVALLRVLQEKKVARIGSNKVIPVDVRIICATNKDLNKLVENGTFRQDLYYRLNVFKIEIPPLRQRRDDIELLFRSFVNQIASEQGHEYTINASVVDLINRYNWPGNVRELHNVAERACNMAENGVISILCLPPELCCSRNTGNPAIAGNKEIKRGILEQEIEEIRALLESERGNISRVAGILGIARSTLYRKIRKHSIN